MVLLKKRQQRKKKNETMAHSLWFTLLVESIQTFPRVLKNSFGGKMTHQLWFVFPFVESFDIFLLEFQLSQKMTQRIHSIILF